MAPPAADVDLAPNVPDVIPSKHGVTTDLRKTPLKYSGSLDGYKSFDVTHVIGREYPELQLSEILKDDRKIRDLAITGECRHSSIDPWTPDAPLTSYLQSRKEVLCSSATKTSASKIKRSWARS